MPKFIVAPDPHPEDKEFDQQHGIDWWQDSEKGKGNNLYWPTNCDVAIECDVGGCLHDHFYSVGKKHGCQED